MASYSYLSPPLSSPSELGLVPIELVEAEMSSCSLDYSNGQKRKDPPPSNDSRSFKRPLSCPADSSANEDGRVVDDNTVQSLSASEYFTELQSEATNDIDAVMAQFASRYYSVIKDLASQVEERYSMSASLFQEVAELVLDEMCKAGPRLPLLSSAIRKHTYATCIPDVCSNRELIKTYLQDYLVERDNYPFLINCILQVTFVPMGQDKDTMVKSVQELVEAHGHTKSLSLHEIHLFDIYGFYAAYVNNNYECLLDTKTPAQPGLNLKELDSVHPKQWFAGPTDSFPLFDLAKFRSLDKYKQELWQSILWAHVYGGSDWSKFAYGIYDRLSDRALQDFGTFYYYYSPAEDIDMYSPVLKRRLKCDNVREIEGYCGCCDFWIPQSKWRDHMRYTHGIISAIRQRVMPPRIMAAHRRCDANNNSVQDTIAYCDQCQQWVDADMPSNKVFHPYEPWIIHVESHLVNDFNIPEDHSAAKGFLVEYYHLLEHLRDTTKTKIHLIIRKWYDLAPADVKSPFFSISSNYLIEGRKTAVFDDLVLQANTITSGHNHAIARMIKDAQTCRHSTPRN